MAKGKFIVYMATAPNNKSYIGQTIRTLRERRKDHEIASRNAARKGVPGCRVFNAALRKYGSANFQWKVLCRADSIEKLNALESECIARHNTRRPNGYNLLSGGGNSRHHPETREKMSGSQKRRWANPTERERAAVMQRGKKRPDLAGKLSGDKNPAKRPEVRAKIGAANKGHTFRHTDEAKRKISEGKRGKKRPDVTARQSGQTRSAETKKKMSEGRRGKPAHNRGKPMSAKQRTKLSAAAKAAWARRKAAKATAEEEKNPSLDF